MKRNKHVTFDLSVTTEVSVTTTTTATMHAAKRRRQSPAASKKEDVENLLARVEKLFDAVAQHTKNLSEIVKHTNALLEEVHAARPAPLLFSHQPPLPPLELGACSYVDCLDEVYNHTEHLDAMADELFGPDTSALKLPDASEIKLEAFEFLPKLNYV